MSVTRLSFNTDLTNATAAATAGINQNTVLSDAEQAAMLQAVMDVLTNHMLVVNPNVKPMPTIKIHT